MLQRQVNSLPNKVYNTGIIYIRTSKTTMEKLKIYFESVGFSGEDLERIIHAFTLQGYEKNDFVVEYGKISKHIGLVNTGIFQYYKLYQ